jgi:hypothetical protein
MNSETVHSDILNRVFVMREDFKDLLDLDKLIPIKRSGGQSPAPAIENYTIRLAAEKYRL